MERISISFYTAEERSLTFLRPEKKTAKMSVCSVINLSNVLALQKALLNITEDLVALRYCQYKRPGASVTGSGLIISWATSQSKRGERPEWQRNWAGASFDKGARKGEDSVLEHNWLLFQCEVQRSTYKVQRSAEWVREWGCGKRRTEVCTMASLDGKNGTSSS